MTIHAIRAFSVMVMIHAVVFLIRISIMAAVIFGPIEVYNVGFDRSVGLCGFQYDEFCFIVDTLYDDPVVVIITVFGIAYCTLSHQEIPDGIQASMLIYLVIDVWQLAKRPLFMPLTSREYDRVYVASVYMFIDHVLYMFASWRPPP
jgi:hypothetical protein